MSLWTVIYVGFACFFAGVLSGQGIRVDINYLELAAYRRVARRRERERNVL
jgi:hypothetical protein